jgi:hypothetical protein
LIYQGLEEEDLHQKSPGPPGLWLMQWASSSLIINETRHAKNQTPSKLFSSKLGITIHPIITSLGKIYELNICGKARVHGIFRFNKNVFCLFGRKSQAVQIFLYFLTVLIVCYNRAHISYICSS